MEAAFTWRVVYDHFNVTNFIDYIIDIMFGIDIVLNFFTSFYHKNSGQEITSRKLIVKNYLTNMFFLDLVSTIPFDTIYIAFFAGGHEDENETKTL